MKDLGVCIVTRQSKEEVLECLSSLFENTKGVDLQVVVVDNDSQDGTVDAIRFKFPAVNLILNNENLGFSRAVNQGLKTLDARYYLLLNPDAIILGDTMQTLIQIYG
jgi:GT2 family glycosyltransferase